MSLSYLKHFRGTSQPMGESPGLFMWPSSSLMGTWATTAATIPCFELGASDAPFLCQFIVFVLFLFSAFQFLIL